MNKLIILLIFSSFSFIIKAQDGCEKFKNEPIKKINIKLVHVSSKTSNTKLFNSFGIESSYYLPFSKKNKFGLQVGLGYYYRNIMNDAAPHIFDVASVDGSYGCSLNHQTLELPIYLKYNILCNKLNKTKLSFYAGASAVYLLEGQLSFYVGPEHRFYNYSFNKISDESQVTFPLVTPFIPKFFPEYNLKLSTGLECFLSPNIGLGLEYNYFVKPIGTRLSGFLAGKDFTPNYTNLSLLLILKF